MFLSLLGTASALVALRFHSKEESNEIRQLIDVTDMTLEYDDSIPKGSYTLRSENISVDAKDIGELRDYANAASILRPAPNDIKDAINSVSTVERTVISDLKSGAFNFAIFFTNSAEDFKILKTIEEVSSFKYFLSSDESLAKSLNASFPGILAYNAEDRNVFSLPFLSSLSAINSAITLTALSKMGSANFKMLQESEQSLLYVIDNSENFKKVSEELNPLMKKKSGEMKFVFFSPEEVPTLIKLVKATVADYPLIINLVKEKKCIHRKVTKNNFEEAVKKLIDGTAEPLKFSSIIPPDNDKKPLRVVSTDTLQPLFKDVSVDRLVAFTSPRCSHCRAMEPGLQKFAKALFDKKVSITVGNYNVIENEEVAELDITGVPVLFYLKKGSNVPVKLPAEARTYNQLMTYVAENGLSASIKAEDFLEAEEAKPAEAIQDMDEESMTESDEAPEANQAVPSSVSASENAKEVL